MRDRFNAFVARHAMAWELAMAGLAVLYVGIGLRTDASITSEPLILLVESALTAIFIGEFAIRILASRDRGLYLRDHVIDLVALIPIARGVRVFRLLRLLRLVRAFAGFNRAFLEIERVASHHGLGTLVIAWFGTMLLSSWAFLLAESGTNPLVHDASDALWWGLMTLTGGPATIQAVTAEGQWITAILLVVGVALFTAITAVLVSFIVTRDRPPSVGDDLLSLQAARAEGAITEAEFERTKTAMLARFERP